MTKVLKKLYIKGNEYVIPDGCHVVNISSLSSTSDAGNVATAITKYGAENVIVRYNYTEGDYVNHRDYFHNYFSEYTENGATTYEFTCTEGGYIYKYLFVYTGPGTTPSYVNSGSIKVVDETSVLTKTNTTSFTPSGDYQPATKKYVDDTVTSTVSDTAYASSWNGVTTIAPSKNAVYDKISAMDTTISGKADSSSLATVATSGSYADLSNKPTIPVVDAALSTTSTNALQNKVITDALNGKLDGFTRMFAGNWSGGVHPVRFVRVDYSTANSENGIFIKMSLVNSHGNGQAGRFLEDVILLVTYTGSVECSIYRYFGTQTNVSGDYYYNSYGDIFWTIDTTNKIVDFFVLMHQFSYTRMTPYFRLNRSTGGVITQAYEGSGNPEYSSGTKSRAIIYDYSKIPTKTSQLTNDSGFITSASLPTKTSDLTNDSGFITSSALSGYQTTSNLKTSLSDNSDTYYPSQKAVKTAVDSKQAQHSSITVTLTSSGWSSNTQTVTATGVTASNTVFVSPAPTSITDYTDAKIYCSAQGSNSLTFTCDTAPTNNITVNVIILN